MLPQAVPRPCVHVPGADPGDGDQAGGGLIPVQGRQRGRAPAVQEDRPPHLV